MSGPYVARTAHLTATNSVADTDTFQLAFTHTPDHLKGLPAGHVYVVTLDREQRRKLSERLREHDNQPV